MHDLTRLGLRELGAAIRARRVSCREVMAAFLDRIAAPTRAKRDRRAAAGRDCSRGRRADRLLAGGEWLGVDARRSAASRILPTPPGS